MRVLAPIRSCDELEMLVECGAEELYCGIIPREWIERANRKPFEEIVETV